MKGIGYSSKVTVLYEGNRTHRDTSHIGHIGTLPILWFERGFH